MKLAINDCHKLLTEKKFIFIGGLHRSGTTPLQRILGQSPIISKMENTGHNEDEGQHCQSVYETAKKVGGPGKFANVESYHYTNNSKLLNEANNFKIINEWAKYWNLSKPILLEKSPPNLIHTLYLQSIFPRSYFIIIIRHPYVCCSATTKRGWSSEKSIDVHIQHWIKAHQIFFEDKPLIKKCFVIRYEEVINDLKLNEKLSVFLDEKLEALQINFENFKNTDADYFKQMPDASLVNKYEQSINAFGYSFLPPYYLSSRYL